MALSIHHPDHFDPVEILQGFDLRQYIERIRQKPAAQRSELERQILDLYTTAQGEGTDFCVNQIMNTVKDWIRRNPILALAAGSGIAYLIFKATK